MSQGQLSAARFSTKLQECSSALVMKSRFGNVAQAFANRKPNCSFGAPSALALRHTS